MGALNSGWWWRRRAAGIWLAVIASAVIVICSGGRHAVVAETPAPTPPPPPGLDLQVTASRPTVERDQPVDLFILVTNKSSANVSALTVTQSNGDFTWVHEPTFPTVITAFAGAQSTSTIQTTSSAKFGQQQVFLTFKYSSVFDNRPIELMQGTAVPIQVVRRFDEETKGFLGGNAAFFYLLLPIIPLFLGFQIVNGKAMAGKFELPEFKAEYAAPAFLMAVILNLGLLLAFEKFQVDFSDPVNMLLVLAGAFLLGLLAAGLVRRDRLRKVFLSFKATDTPFEYLSKLLTKQDIELHEWVTGTDANSEEWSGILLPQPIGPPALGATFQLTRTDKAPDVDTLKRDVFDANGVLRDNPRSRKSLLSLLKAGAFTLSFLERVQQGSTAQGRKDVPVVTGIDGLKVTVRQVHPLVRLA